MHTHELWISYSRKKYRLIGCLAGFNAALLLLTHNTMIGSDVARIVDVTTGKKIWFRTNRTIGEVGK